MRIAFARWRSEGLLNRPSPRKRLPPKKKTSNAFEFVSGLADGASAMPAKCSRPVFSFKFYEGKISLNPDLADLRRFIGGGRPTPRSPLRGRRRALSRPGTRAEEWLQTIHSEIEQKLIAPRSAFGTEQTSA